MVVQHKSMATKRALVISAVVDLIDVLTNLAVAIVTGSVVMVAETLEGIADMTSVSLLLIGRKRAQHKADTVYQFGYGKELYFWALLSAVIMLLISATLAFYFGLHKFLNPESVHLVFLAYIVLGLAIATNGYALAAGLRALLAGKPLVSLPRILLESPLLATKTAIVLDTMGTLAAFFGLVSLIIYGVSGDSRFDGIGGMAIGVILAISAVVLLGGIRGLITGRSVPKPLARTIRRAAMTVPGVHTVLELRTMILGATTTLASLEIHFEDRLSTDEIEQRIDQVKAAVAQVVPGDTLVQVEPETPRSSRAKHRRKHAQG